MVKPGVGSRTLFLPNKAHLSKGWRKIRALEHRSHGSETDIDFEASNFVRHSYRNRLVSPRRREIAPIAAALMPLERAVIALGRNDPALSLKR